MTERAEISSLFLYKRTMQNSMNKNMATMNGVNNCKSFKNYCSGI